MSRSRSPATRHRFRDKEFSHTPTVHERLDWQYGPALQASITETTFEEGGPAVSEEEAANAFPSIESDDVESEVEEESEKFEESDEDDEGYMSESESESGD